MSWGIELWDQFDNLEKHTQWGIDILEKYIKFVKERTEIELSYAKQLRNLSKKYQPKKNSKEEEEYRYTACQAFLATLNEMNDYAGQHELISENMTSQIIVELVRYVQELKQERKSKIQEMEERRIVRIGESVKTYAELDRQVIPIIGKCLDGIVKAAESIDPKNAWLAEVEGRLPARSDQARRQSGMYEAQNAPSVNNCAQDRESSPDGSYTEEQSQESEVKVLATDFDDEFDDEEPLPAIGTCKALYTFEGQNEGTISVVEGETLYVIEEDKGDGWTRIRRNEDEEGYVPTSYVEVYLDKNAKGVQKTSALTNN